MTTDTALTFARLKDVPPDEILTHMRDPRVAEHLPLLTTTWDSQSVAEFIAAKEDCWQRDGLGHWAILLNGSYIGWGGFQKEGREWDFGLVLKPEHFGLGWCITRMALGFARTDDRIEFVTFLLPLSRTRLRALERLGAGFVGETVYEGHRFRKYRLETSLLAT